MKKTLLATLLFCLPILASARTLRSLSGEWQFTRADASCLDALPAADASNVWTTVRVPHDWAIAGPFDPNGDPNTAKLPWKGVGWYRKDFTLSSDEIACLKSGGELEIDFEGVMARAQVWVNGLAMGLYDYGYLGFTVNARDAVHEGVNHLVVKADTRDLKSRWYPGAGLYREVHLRVLEPVHVDAVYVTSANVSTNEALLRVAFDLTGAPFADVSILDPHGRLAARSRGVSPLEFRLTNPELWDIGHGALYTVTVAVGDDALSVRTGLRDFAFTADDGFHLNGRRVDLHGVNLHADLGPLGMAFNRSALARELTLLREMGVNAIRTAHNPPAPQLLDLCDEIGLFVWDECFDKWNNTAGRRRGEDLDEFISRHLGDFVVRDRNHPCVFVWSIGNEIWCSSQGTGRLNEGTNRERVELFRDAVRAFDTTRPVAMGCCQHEVTNTDDLVTLDLTGWNYQEKYRVLREKYPDKPLVYSESASAVSSAGYFAGRPANHRLDFATNVWDIDSYDHNAPAWGDIPDHEFYRMARDRYCAGEFVWSGFDYLGEPSPYHNGAEFAVSNALMSRSSYFGIFDLTGRPKDRYWLYRSQWRTDVPTVHILPHWNWEGTGLTNLPVYVYTSGDAAELFLNGRSLGRRAKRKVAPEEIDLMRKPLSNDCQSWDDYRTNPYYRVCDQYRLRWFDVPYEPGELKVVAYAGTRVIGEETIRTAGNPAAIRLSPERDTLTDNETLAYVNVSVVDAAGVRCPTARTRLHFSLTGPGEIVAVANGDARDHDSFAATDSHALYAGHALVIVRRTSATSAAPLRLTAEADGLIAATIEIKSAF